MYVHIFYPQILFMGKKNYMVVVVLFSFLLNTTCYTNKFTNYIYRDILIYVFF